MPQVYMVPLDMKLGRTEMTNILRTGHSRIPVHEPGSPQDVIGLLLVKELVLLDPDDEVRTAVLAWGWQLAQ
jgi:CBS domain containing-hemolysin-like protein